MFLTLKVKYFHRLLKPLEYIDGKSDWIDLRCAEPVSVPNKYDEWTFAEGAGKIEVHGVVEVRIW